MIYLDNAATSYPKPESVTNAVLEGIIKYGGNPGRSGHDMSINAAQKVFHTREKINAFFGGYGAENVAFTYNCTYALNIAIKGIINEGDHVLVTSIEHNAVLRPLYKLKNEGKISYDIINCKGSDKEILIGFEKAITPKTKAIICTHSSNVFGKVMPIKELGELAKRKGIIFIVDAAGSAGILHINMRDMNINCLCMPGHKSIYGITGIGILLFDGSIKNTIIEGGTGSRSFELAQPSIFPDMLESGTLNMTGICSVSAGIDFILKEGMTNIYEHEYGLIKEAMNDLSGIKNVILYSESLEKNKYTPVLPFNVKTLHSERVAAILCSKGIAVRAGFHCACAAHITYKTESIGAVRISPSVYTEKKDLKSAINCISQIAKSV